MTAIDTTFDFRTDANGGDPDKTSPTLRRYHQLLWSKPLPNGKLFELTCNFRDRYLYHRSELGEFVLTSDSVLPTFTSWKRCAHIIGPKEEDDHFDYITYTIGGMMIFPGNKVNGQMTINGERGFNQKISDRFDLTLECIRRYYNREDSPLRAALDRYADYFCLFDDFHGYVDFFLLQDLVTDDQTAIRFFAPFDDFNSPPIPANTEDYSKFRIRTIQFVNNRNRRIANLFG